MKEHKPRPLAPKQALFIKEYLIDLKAGQAAIRAGYSPRSARTMASRLLSKPHVQAALAAEFKKRDQRIEVTQDYVVSTILDTVERCRQAKPVYDKEGKPVMAELPDGSMAPAYVFESRSVLKGCELLGKHKGMFRDLPDGDDAPLPTKVVIEVVDGRKKPDDS
jgi:phage terminase small subunit